MNDKSTVMIVDDDHVSRDIIEGFLFNEGYEFIFAANGAEALALLDQSIPDVILLDVMMPDMDGFTVCERIKSVKQWQHIPIILVTALNSKEDLVRGYDAGADDFLNKPVVDYELRARVRSMLRIKKQYDELQTAIRLREDLAHMIVHDMKTPLTAILGFSMLLQTKEGLSPENLEEVNKIYTQARRLSSFMNDILMVAKMEKAGSLTLLRSSTDVNQLVREVEKDHLVVARLKRIRLVTDLPAESRQVSLDVNLFHRILDNLFSNALKFSPPLSTVTVQVEYPTRTGSQETDIDLRVRFADEGPGIPAESRERIFEKFEVVQLEQRHTTQVGLGLVFCKMAVEAHGGRIFVEANKPTGSIFTIEF